MKNYTEYKQNDTSLDKCAFYTLIIQQYYTQKDVSRFRKKQRSAVMNPS